jgi:hypothetical protein
VLLYRNNKKINLRASRNTDYTESIPEQRANNRLLYHKLGTTQHDISSCRAKYQQPEDIPVYLLYTALHNSLKEGLEQNFKTKRGLHKKNAKTSHNPTEGVCASHYPILAG